MWPYSETAIRELQRRVQQGLPLNHAADFAFPERIGWQEYRARNGVLRGRKFVMQTPRKIKEVGQPVLNPLTGNNGKPRDGTLWYERYKERQQDSKYKAKEAARKRAERAAKPKRESKLGIRERQPFTHRQLPNIDWLESM